VTTPCDDDALDGPGGHDYGVGALQEDGSRRWVCCRCGDVQTVSAQFLERLREDAQRIFARTPRIVLK